MVMRLQLQLRELPAEAEPIPSNIFKFKEITYNEKFRIAMRPYELRYQSLKKLF